MWFLASEKSHCLVTGFEPRGLIHRYVIIVPPFAEEMNKSRKMVSDFARAMAGHGDATTAVYIIDLFGCGDSEGLLEQASWDIWRANIIDLTTQLQVEHPSASCIMLGIRLGAALALDCIIKPLLPQKISLVFWQPVLNGKQFIHQFLRLKVAASILTSQPLNMAQIRQKLAAEEAIEVSGYLISSALVDEIEDINHHQLIQLKNDISIAWFETNISASETLLPANEKIVNQWQQQNEVVRQIFVSPPFWQSVDTVVVPALVERTVNYVKTLP